MAKVFRAPALNDDEEAVLRLIEAQRDQLRHRVGEPRRWLGSLRRVSEGKAVQGSNSIEGYNASLDDVLALQAGDEAVDADLDTRHALEGYHEAITYVLQASQDPALEIDAGLLKALQFMMLKHDLQKHPGSWRPGLINVARSDTGAAVYEGPPREMVPGLIDAMLDELRSSSAPVVIRAAIAHLNLTMIHPFSDGNGRMARCVQTLVLAQEKIIAPVFSSIEEYLGRNTQAYHEVLAETGQGSWHPENDPHQWVRFCLTAHYRQAETLMRRLTAFEAMWDVASNLARRRRLPERAIGPIAEAAYGVRIRRATYIQNVEVTFGESIAELTASRDLRALVNAGLLLPIGDTRGRYYMAADELKAEWSRIREKDHVTTRDPFERANAERQPALFGP
jgi:Fic family protein